MPPIIEVKQLTKQFGENRAVNGINISIPKGEIFGLLGPNAAGKSTTIRLLSGILGMDEGEANILGYDLKTEREKIKARIGYVAQFFALYPELTARENLDFYSAIYPGNDGEEDEQLLQTYGLSSVADQRAGELSGGYKRRLSIACAMAHDPELIFLDEPTAGIDPVTRKELWEQFYTLASEGKTLFVTTHYMEEAERCNQLAFIHRGNLVADGTPSDLISSLDEYLVFVAPVRHDGPLSRSLMDVTGVQLLNQFGEELRIVASQSVDRDALQRLLAPYGVESLRQGQASIEDVFMLLTREGSGS